MSSSAAKKLRLHDGQADVFDANVRFKVVTAGRRWGKTQLAKVTLILEAAKRPSRTVWYVAPSYRMAKGIMWEELVESIPKAWIKKINHTDLSVKLKNNSRIECKGADQPDSLRGRGLAYLVCDEFQDFKEETWVKVLRPMLARDRGGALFIGTPKGYANLYELHRIGQDTKAPQWRSWQFPTITSPFIPAQEIEDARRDMDPKSFKQEFEASFETMAGRVYYPFDRFTHVGDYKFNPNLPIWVGQDFNVDPMSSVILQPQPNGEVWAIDEIYLHDSSTEAVCEELEKRYWRNLRQVVVYPDPAGGNRSSARGESDLDVFREKGFKRLKYRKKHPLIADRVNSVNRLLMDASGRIRLRVDRSCVNLIASFEQVLYKKGTREIDKSLNIEHITDSIGYCLEIEFPSRKVEIMGVSI